MIEPMRENQLTLVFNSREDMVKCYTGLYKINDDVYLRPLGIKHLKLSKEWLDSKASMDIINSYANEVVDLEADMPPLGDSTSDPDAKFSVDLKMIEKICARKLDILNKVL